MSKKDEALKLALEALEQSHPEAYRHTIAAIREALAEQPAQQQEPVVRWVCKGCRHEYMEAPSSCDCMESTEYERVEYFTSPPASKPLTDEQIDAIWDAVITPSNHIREFVRAIEAAHGIKGDA